MEQQFIFVPDLTVSSTQLNEISTERMFSFFFYSKEQLFLLVMMFNIIL